MANILTLQEAKNSLRVDSDFNDDIILALLDSVDAQVYVATGRRWELDDPVPALAKSAARIALDIEYTKHTDDLTNNRLTAKFIQLQALRRQMEGHGER